MALIGVIGPEQDSAGVDLDRWRRLIAADPRLERSPPRDIVNPFTGKPTVVVPPDTAATIVLDAVQVGAITVSDSDAIELSVWAADEHHDQVHEVAAAIAAQLDGHYVPLP